MRGQVDILFLTVIFTLLAIIFLFTYFIYGQIMTPLNTVINPSNTNANIAAIGGSMNQSFLTLGDLYTIVYFAIGIAAIITAFFVGTSPIFFILAIFMLMIEILVSVLMHNLFFTIAQQPLLIGITQQFPLMVTIFEYYPMFTFVIALAVAIALYSK